MPRPNKLHDELDALLDGRPVELTDELAPLAEAADELRVELAGLQLDPEVADRHLEWVLHGSAPVVQLPVRGRASGWELRRRVVAVALAAALVLAPATIASAAALPGQAMYPLKLGIEQVRIASVQWSPPREAAERTRVAQERLEELNRLVELRMFNQIAAAVSALDKAVIDAQAAVQEAGQEGQPVPGVANMLNAVTRAGGETLAMVAATALRLPEGTREAITAAVAETQVVKPPDREIEGAGTPPTAPPTPTTPTTHATSGGGGGSDPTSPSAPPSTAPPPETTQPPAPTTTAPPSTSPPTTQPPQTTEATTPPTSSGGGGDVGSGGAERSPAEGDQAPPTTLPAP
jgi:Domain of unknown function (DUF5667)